MRSPSTPTRNFRLSASIASMEFSTALAIVSADGAGLSFAMSQGLRRRGYAEVNPRSMSMDTTPQKLAILASLAFGTKVNQSAVYVEGISSIAQKLRALAIA